MRLVIQRVKSAGISINKGEVRHMGAGLVVLFAASDTDTGDYSGHLIQKLAEKTAKIRIFSDAEGKMNLSALDLGLSVMVVSQFTLFADTKKGNRPSFSAAAEPVFAEKIYNEYVDILRGYSWKEFLTGEFGAMMTVELTNDGPVTIIIDTKEWERGS